MEGEDEIKKARGILQDYHTTLKGVCALTLFPKDSEEYNQLREIVLKRLGGIKEANSEKKFAKEYFQYDISDEEISTLCSLISDLEKGIDVSKENVRKIQERALGIETIVNSNRYIN